MSMLGFKILLCCIFILLCLIIILIILLVEKRNANNILSKKIPTNKININKQLTNSLFATGGSEKVDFFAISLITRKETHFNLLEQDLKKENISLNYVEGINGKALNLEDYNLSSNYKDFFVQNQKELQMGKTQTNYMGHLGCTLSHLSILNSIENMTVILEDDADITPNFRYNLQKALNDVYNVDPNWEILLLGFCARYDDHHYHKLNDKEPIYFGGIVKVHFWIGGWSYIIRNKQIANKIKLLFNPISWHIDLTLAENARLKKLNVYGIVPPLINHPGLLRISSWDTNQYGDPSKIKTDTNK